MTIGKPSPLDPLKSSYVWSKSDSNEKTEDELELIEYFKKSIRGWTLSSLIFMALFFVYHFLLAPNVQLLELLLNNDQTTYNTHIILKSVIIVFFIISSLNANLITVIYFWTKSNDVKNLESKIHFIKVFKWFLYFFYITLFLFIISKNANDFMKLAINKLEEVKKTKS